MKDTLEREFTDEWLCTLTCELDGRIPDDLILQRPGLPTIAEFIRLLTERGYQNRTVWLIENGSWAPCVARFMRAMLEGFPGVSFAETVVSIDSVLNETSRAQTEAHWRRRWLTLCQRIEVSCSPQLQNL